MYYFWLTANSGVSHTRHAGAYPYVPEALQVVVGLLSASSP